jgi:hypothetical protein
LRVTRNYGLLRQCRCRGKRGDSGACDKKLLHMYLLFFFMDPPPLRASL